MSTPEVEFKKGDVENPGGQMPQGSAQELNEGAELAEDLAEQTGSEQPVETAPPAFDEAAAAEDLSAPEDVVFDEGGGGQFPSFVDEEDQLLYGPTVRPDEPIFTGTRMGAKAPPPADIEAWFPRLREAANQPDAPQELRDLVRILTYHLEG